MVVGFSIKCKFQSFNENFMRKWIKKKSRVMFPSDFQFRIQNMIPFVLGCLLRFVGLDFVNFLILIFLVIFHISSLIFFFTRIRVFYGLLAFLWFLFLFICIVASKVFHNFININFKMFSLHSFWWTSIFLGN